MKEYEGTSSEEDEYDDQDHNEYSSESDDDDDDDEEDEDYYDHNQIHPKKRDHQLEWDDEVLEYGPKKV
jgi:hypothetical protein